MPLSISDPSFYNKLLQAETSCMHLGDWGGRFAEVDGKNLSMNTIVQDFKVWAKQSEDLGLKRKIIAKIRVLDACHPENTASILIYLLTRIRQIIGNWLYDRKLVLDSIEKGLPQTKTKPEPDVSKTPTKQNPDIPNLIQFYEELQQPKPQPVPPLPEPVVPPLPAETSVRSVTPPKKPPSPRFAETPQKKGPVVQKWIDEKKDEKKVVSAVEPEQKTATTATGVANSGSQINRRDISKSGLEKKLNFHLETYKEWNGEGDLADDVKKELFPSIQSIPFWPGPGPIFYRAGFTPSRRSTDKPYLGDTLLDRILILNGHCEEEKRLDVKAACYKKGNYNSIQNFNEFIGDLFKQHLTIKYLTHALVYLNLEQKSVILDLCLEILSIDALHHIFNGFCKYYKSQSKIVHIKDATLERLLKHYTNVCLKDRKRTIFDKEVLFPVLRLAMQGDSTIEWDWLGNVLRNMKPFLAEEDIVMFMEHFQKHHQIYEQHKIFIELTNLLPEEKRSDIVTKISRNATFKEPERKPPPRWIPQSQRHSTPGALPTPTTETPATSVGPIDKMPKVSEAEKKLFDEYKNHERSPRLLVQRVIPMKLTFVRKSQSESGGAKNKNTLYGTGDDVKTLIRKITGNVDIDLRDKLTLRILGDVLAFSDNLGDVKQNILAFWLKKMDSTAIDSLLAEFFHVNNLLYEGPPPEAKPTPKLLLEEIFKLDANKVKKIDKKMLIDLIKFVLPCTGDKLDFVQPILSQMIDYQIIDTQYKIELAELFKRTHSTNQNSPIYILLTEGIQS